MADDLINFDLPTERSSIIKVLGVGGGGSNAVNHMFKQGIKDVNFVVCNTDSQALANSPVTVKIQLGESLTEGRGAGNKPDIGRQAAIENLDDIIEILSSNTKMVFITAGMGGGTGTGAAPVIAKAAKELGILTVAIVTIPFRFEGHQRIQQAVNGINALKEHVDSLLVINNEKLREIYGDLKLSEAFSRADNVLATAAKGIAEVITVHGYINVDFADVQTVMSNSGVAIMGSGIASGENRALEAIQQAVNSPLLNNNEITGAQNILLNITSGIDEISMDEVGEITDFVNNCVSSDALIIWGTGMEEGLGDSVNVTIIATGFETNSIPELYVKKKQTNKVPLNDSTKRNVAHKEGEFEVKERKNKNFSLEDNVSAQRTIEFDIQKEQSYGALNDEEAFAINQQKSAERVKILKNTHARLKTQSYNNPDDKENIDKLENEPAYRRKNIKLDEESTGNDTEISRYSLSDDGENKTRLRPNNPYLHDNVD